MQRWPRRWQRRPRCRKSTCRAARLSEAGALASLKAAGIPVMPHRVATNASDAIAAAESFGFPVVAKIVSPDILHKTEIGGVALNLQTKEQVAKAFDDLMSRAKAAKPQARIEGVLIAPMIKGGVECILGVQRDPVFGPVVMFGLGGILVEALRDVSFRLAPFDKAEAHRMIDSIKARAVLDGWRGAPAADIDALADALVALSRFAAAAGDKLESIDINPFVVHAKGQGRHGARRRAGGAGLMARRKPHSRRRPRESGDPVVAAWRRGNGPWRGTGTARLPMLAIQDTSEINFRTKPARRRGLGEIGKGTGHGLLLHAMAAVDADSDACLGLVAGKIWTRQGRVTVPHDRRPLEQKKWERWVSTANRAKQVLSAATMVEVIDDREGDIYAKWASVSAANFHLLTRSMHDRVLADGASMYATLPACPLSTTRPWMLWRAPMGQPGRPSWFCVSEGSPQKAAGRVAQLGQDRRDNLVEVAEVDPPAGVDEPLHWYC